jgi:hypothetical protein
MQAPNFDLTFHTAELLTIMTAAGFVIRAANRVWTVLKDFPPHRHINGSIIYPEGFEPTAIGVLGISPNPPGASPLQR